MFQVSVGGCNSRHPEPYVMFRPKGLSEYLLLIVKTKAAFSIGQQELTVDADCAIIIPPDLPYRYQSVSGDYINDWIHFSCDSDSVWSELLLPLCTPIPLPDPSRFSMFLQQIFWERNYGSSRFRTENVSLLMQLLMHNLADAYRHRNSQRRYSPYYSRLQTLRLTMQSQPDRSYEADRIAENLGISTSYFQHLYTEFFGISFQSDRIRMRIEYARQLLAGTSLPIRLIAEMCGYSSEVHFYRQFKAHGGMTPAEYRDCSSTGKRS
ncbi:MAG: helix-turn-helix domain-containing protein [Lachnospiraceae bacterium]|nr:helix-turn-helix domain-containing protein [Lachnospiraceae bacterium]